MLLWPWKLIIYILFCPSTFWELCEYVILCLFVEYDCFWGNLFNLFTNEKEFNLTMKWTLIHALAFLPNVKERQQCLHSVLLFVAIASDDQILMTRKAILLYRVYMLLSFSTNTTWLVQCKVVKCYHNSFWRTISLCVEINY